MKTIVVGDMHQKQHPILPIVDNAIRFLGARRVVLLGDYCDDYSPDRDTTDAKKLLEGLEFQADWIDRTRGRGIQVDALLGNHDMQYLIERQGPGTNLNCIIPAQRLLAQMNVRMAAAVDGWLATHAGLTSQFADIVLEIDVEAESFGELSYSADSLAAQLNATFDHALSEMFEHGNDEELLLFQPLRPRPRRHQHPRATMGIDQRTHGPRDAAPQPDRRPYARLFRPRAGGAGFPRRAIHSLRHVFDRSRFPPARRWKHPARR